MKRTICCIISVLLLIPVITSSISANTDDCYNWYIIRNKGGYPSFPREAEFVSNHGGYYIDIKAKECNQKKLYLTFDAGYENGNIEKILNTLKSENVPAAFFILSNLITKNTELVKRMSAEGHLVCNHTKNHKDMTKLTNEEMKNNLLTLEHLYEEKTGLKMAKFFRFPEGHYNEASLLCAEEMGYKTVFWSMAYADWDDNKQPNENKAINKLLSITHPGAIILLHPTSKTNATILPVLIKEWKAQGYTFGTLEELIKNNT